MSGNQGEQDPVVYHSASDRAISTTISNVSNSEDRERIKREYKGLSGIWLRIYASS